MRAGRCGARAQTASAGRPRDTAKTSAELHELAARINGDAGHEAVVYLEAVRFPRACVRAIRVCISRIRVCISRIRVCISRVGAVVYLEAVRFPRACVRAIRVCISRIRVCISRIRVCISRIRVCISRVGAPLDLRPAVHHVTGVQVPGRHVLLRRRAVSHAAAGEG